MRGHWESGTRKLNRHYQSGGSFREQLILFDFPEDDPFQASGSATFARQVCFGSGAIYDGSYSMNVPAYQIKYVPKLKLKPGLYELKYDIHVVDDEVGVFSGLNYATANFPYHTIDNKVSNQIYFAGDIAWFDTTEDATYNPGFPKGFTGGAGTTWTMSGRSLGMGEGYPLRVKAMTPYSRWYYSWLLGVSAYGLDVYDSDEIETGAPMIFDLRGYDEYALSKSDIINAQFTWGRNRSGATAYPVFWGKCWLEHTETEPNFDIVIPWGYYDESIQ